MSSLYLMIPLGLALMALAIWLFVWALKNGQFEDLDGPAWSIIMDEDQSPEQAEMTKQEQSKHDHTGIHEKPSEEQNP